MNITHFYNVLSIISISFGLFLLASSQFTMLGAIIGIEEISSFTRVSFGVVFLMLGVALFLRVIKKAKKKQ